MKLFILYLTLLTTFQTQATTESRYDQLEKFIKEKKISNLDELTLYLNKDKKEGGVFNKEETKIYNAYNYHARGLVKSSLSKPKILGITTDGKFSYAMAGHRSIKKGEILEIIEYNEKLGTNEFKTIDFTTQNPFFGKADNKSCLECHTDRRLIWDTYPSWPGFFGSSSGSLNQNIDDFFIKRKEPNRPNIPDFEKKILDLGITQGLKRLENTLQNRLKDLPRGIVFHQENTRFDNAVNNNNIIRVINHLQKMPRYMKYYYFIKSIDENDTRKKEYYLGVSSTEEIEDGFNKLSRKTKKSISKQTDGSLQLIGEIYKHNSDENVEQYVQDIIQAYSKDKMPINSELFGNTLINAARSYVNPKAYLVFEDIVDEDESIVLSTTFFDNNYFFIEHGENIFKHFFNSKPKFKFEDMIIEHLRKIKNKRDYLSLFEIDKKFLTHYPESSLKFLARTLHQTFNMFKSLPNNKPVTKEQIINIKNNPEIGFFLGLKLNTLKTSLEE